MKMTGGMEQLSYEDRELGLFRLEKRRLQEDLFMVFQYPKGAYKKDGKRLFERACSVSTRTNGFKLRGHVYIKYKEGILYCEVVQRTCGCPLPGGVQGWVGWDSKQPGVVKGVPAWGSERHMERMVGIK